MVIGIFGESCTGKSTLAEKIATGFPCEVFTGKDYLRLAKNETIAKVMFQKKLTTAVTGENIIYVISEKEHLPLLPEGGTAYPCDGRSGIDQVSVRSENAWQPACACSCYVGKEARLFRCRAS